VSSTSSGAWRRSKRVADLADVVVLGAGPAGAALAAACSSRGLDAVVVAPDPEAPWTPTYAAWVDDLDDLSGIDPRLTDPVVWAHRWPGVVVHGARRHDVMRPYGLLANDSLRAALAAAHTGARLAASAARVRHHVWGSQVELDDGRTVDARLVVDARGSRREPSDAAQVAYGLVVRADPVVDRARPDLLVDPCVLMDWRPTPGGEPDATPSFLYVLRRPDGTLLVEETSLAARPPADLHMLRDRLTGRVGLDLTDEATHVEHVHIPVGVPVPRPFGPLVPFGAAAGYVHPATGYSVAASLRAAPRVADAISAGLVRELPPDALSADVWAAVWPRAQRRTRALQDFGLAALLRLDASATAAFFDAFFDCDTQDWAPYMRVDADPGEVMAVMRRIFAAVPWRVRRSLALGDPRTLTRLLVP
jgi:lycopene beta-cyclase